jgi:hypothetical protein
MARSRAIHPPTNTGESNLFQIFSIIPVDCVARFARNEQMPVNDLSMRTRIA